MHKKLILLLLVCLSVSQAWAQRPVEFVQNQGQWQHNFEYKASTPQGDIYLQKGGYTINLASLENHDRIHALKHGEITEAPKLNFHAYQVSFVNANANPKITGQKPQAHYYNYFLNENPENWKSNIHPHLAVQYEALYPGVNAKMYTDAGKLKYDLLIRPNADASQIKMQYKGVDGLSLDKGNLVIKTSLGDMKEMKPYAYQIVGGVKQEVKCNYAIENQSVRFDFPKGYNTELELVIDPILVFSTFSGSTGDNWGTTATYDQFGNYYGGGFNILTGFPVTLGAYDLTYNGGSTATGGGQAQDVSILKFDPSGATLRYATYIGGIDNEQPHSLVVDTTTGNLIIAGRTYSNNFPTSPNPYDATWNGGADMFVFVIDSTGGNMVGSTYVGGSSSDGVNITAAYTSFPGLKHNYGNDARSEVIVDNTGNIYVSAMTTSSNFPVTPGTFQPNIAGAQDGVIFELNPDCSNLLWSTFLGGSADDACYVLSFDKTNPNILYVAGGTASNNFPATAGSLHSSSQGGIDGFLARFNAGTKALVAATYIGTSAYDQVYGVQTDDNNDVYITGQTLGAYPTTAGVYSNPNSPQFITKLNAGLTNILISTVFGSGSLADIDISPTAFLVDRCGNIYVSGWGGPTGGNPGSTVNLPTTPASIVPPMRANTDGSDFYFFVVNNNMTSLVYGAYFGILGSGPITFGGEHVDGGTSRFDPNGVIYQAMCASCGVATGFPTSQGSHSPVKPAGVNCNLGAVKIDFQLQDPDAEASAGGNTRGCAPHTVNFINNSTSATGFIWDFGDGSPTSTANNPSHTYTQAGVYTAKLTALNPNGCTFSSDTDIIVITVLDDSVQANFQMVKVDSCDPYTANFINTTTYNNGPTNPGTTYSWNFGDGTTFGGMTPPLHSFPAPQSYTVQLIVTDTNACNSPDTISIVIDYSTSVVLAGFNAPDSVCLPANINFTDASTNATGYAWTFGDGGTSQDPDPTHEYTSAGNYNVRLVTVNPASCNLIDSFQKSIRVFGSPTANFTYSPNPPTPNTALNFRNLSTGAISYNWDFGDGTSTDEENPKKIYNRDGFYNVCLTAKNEFNCIDTFCQTVRGNVIPLVDVPTGFSPNGDGANDILNVLGYGIETLTFKVYNRWGELVFETRDQFQGWDGTYKGEPQEMDTYGYLLDISFFDGSKRLKKGNVTLIR
jgi:gliding motility-associated-like protein